MVQTNTKLPAFYLPQISKYWVINLSHTNFTVPNSFVPELPSQYYSLSLLELPTILFSLTVHLDVHLVHHLKLASSKLPSTYEQKLPVLTVYTALLPMAPSELGDGRIIDSHCSDQFLQCSAVNVLRLFYSFDFQSTERPNC